MVNDPYKILGVPQGASQDEIKKAYRKKAKECHPDLHPDDPDARTKMQQVNEAYDMLMNPGKYQSRQQGNPYGQYSSYGQQGGSYGQQGNPYGQYGWYDFEDLFGYGRRAGNSFPPPQEMPGDSEAVRRAIYAINTHQFQAALQLLNSLPGSERNARWYYLSSLSNQGMGNFMAAMEQMERAVQMDPGNQLYRQLLQQFSSAGQTYAQHAQGFNMHAFDPRRLCLCLCLSQMFCPFCRFFFCC